MMNNGAVHIIATIIRHFILSVSKAKVVELFINANEGITLRNALKELGNPQPTRPLKMMIHHQKAL